MHRVLHELGIEDDVLLWNLVPTHPGTATSNRRPTNSEVLDALYVRHPSHGAAAEFAAGLRRTLAL